MGHVLIVPFVAMSAAGILTARYEVIATGIVAGFVGVVFLALDNHRE